MSHLVLKHCYNLKAQESKPKQGLKVPGAGLVMFWWAGVIKTNVIFTNIKESSSIPVRQHFQTCMITYKNGSANIHKFINPPKDTHLPLCPDEVMSWCIKNSLKAGWKLCNESFPTSLLHCKNAKLSFNTQGRAVAEVKIFARIQFAYHHWTLNLLIMNS